MKTPRALVRLLCAAAALVAGARADEVAPHSRLDVLARTSAETGWATYRQIAHAAYGERDEAVIAAKRAWRAANPGLPWVSEYELFLLVAVNIRVAPHAPEAKEDRAIAARYTLETNTATLPRSGAGALLAHEVAHGLTRRSVRNDAQKQLVDSRIDLGIEPPRGAFARESGFNLEWFSYVATQCEFEIRLQALNRFHFETTGRMIDSPAEALRAVATLGIDLQSDEIIHLFAENPTHAIDAATARMITTATRSLWSTKPECFRNADDLRKVVQMATAWSPELRRAVLAKIAMEAPGHF